MKTKDKETVAKAEKKAEKKALKAQKKADKLSPKKKEKLLRKAEKKQAKLEKLTEKRNGKIEKKYPKKKAKFENKQAKVRKKYEKKLAKAQKKGKAIKEPKILSKEFAYPKNRNYPPEIAADPTFKGKIKRAFYIEKKRNRVIAIIAVILVVALIVGCCASTAGYNAAEEKWAYETNSKVDKIVADLNTIVIKLGGEPMEEDSLSHIDRQLDRILELLDASPASAEEKAAIESELGEITGEIGEAQSGSASAGSGKTASGTGAKSQSGVKTSQPGTPAAKGGSTQTKSGVPSTKKEIIDYCNNAVNAVKSSKAGFKKVYIRKVTGDVGGLPSWLTSLADVNETSTLKKGQSSNDVFPAAGYAWSSKLTENDIKTYDFKTAGNIYKITLRLVDENNPKKGEGSHYGRCMSVMEQNDVLSMTSLIKSVDMHYYNGYLYAEINSQTGKVQKAEFSATADLKLNISVLGDVKATGIVSTETFTDFVW